MGVIYAYTTAELLDHPRTGAAASSEEQAKLLSRYAVCTEICGKRCKSIKQTDEIYISPVSVLQANNQVTRTGDLLNLIVPDETQVHANKAKFQKIKKLVESDEITLELAKVIYCEMYYLFMIAVDSHIKDEHRGSGQNNGRQSQGIDQVICAT